MDLEVKKIIDALISMYGHDQALIKYEKAMRDKRYYHIKHEDSIQEVLEYIKNDKIKKRADKLSTLFEKKVFDYNTFLFINSTK